MGNIKISIGIASDLSRVQNE